MFLIFGLIFSILAFIVALAPVVDFLLKNYKTLKQFLADVHDILNYLHH